MVSRVVEGKGLSVLLNAIDTLDCEDITVTVVGDGSEREGTPRVITDAMVAHLDAVYRDVLGE